MTRRRHGAAFASYWSMVVLLAASLPACLVASEHEFTTEEEFPASIVDGDESVKIGDRIKWNRRGQSLTFVVVVRDPNIEDDLWARWVVQSGTQPELLSPCNPETGEDRLIPVNGTPERELRFTIEPGQIRENGCYRLVLSVSSQFNVPCTQARNTPTTALIATPHDNIDLASWWLLVDDGSASDSDADLEASCETKQPETVDVTAPL